MKYMHSEWQKRLSRWIETLKKDLYLPLGDIAMEAFMTMDHLSPEQAMQQTFTPIAPGTQWGHTWEYCWMKSQITLPKEAEGKRIVMDLHTGGETTVFVDGMSFGTYRAEWVQTPHHYIVDNVLIPALDQVGADFEQNKVFLPQLIQSAGAAQAAFEVIREKLSTGEGGNVSRGNVVLATVKGDIHDIGKNIVKVLLENYGYTVIDLGRDVDPAAVVEAARKYEAPLVGLSALMTTTLPAMEETVARLKALPQPPAVMVGGAVVTADYAERIGADYYARDAREAVEIARGIFG